MIRIKIKYIIWFMGCLAIYYLFKNTEVVNTPIKKKLIEKVVTSDRYGRAMYNYKWLLPNGDTQVDVVDFEYSNNLEIYKTYIFNQVTYELK